MTFDPNKTISGMSESDKSALKVQDMMPEIKTEALNAHGVDMKHINGKGDEQVIFVDV